MLFKKPSVVEETHRIYKETLSSVLPAVKDVDKLYASPEHLFYYDQNTKTIRRFQGDKTRTVDGKWLVDYIKEKYKTYPSDSVKLFNTLCEYLMVVCANCTFGKEYPKYLCRVFENCDYPERIHFEDPTKNFININGTICYCKANIDKIINFLMPVTAQNFDNILITPFCYPNMSLALKKRIIKNLKGVLTPILPLCDSGIFDLEYNHICFKKNKFVALPSAGRINRPLPRVPYVFCNGIYRFSDRMVKFLRNTFNDNYTAFDNFTQLMFSAYNCDLPMKKATVIITAEENREVFISFFKGMFYNDIAQLNYYDFTDVAFQNTTPFIANLFCLKVLLIANDPQINNYSRVRALVNSTYQRVTDPVSGMIKYKNTIPVVLITSDEEYANKFKRHINSNTIYMQHFSPDKAMRKTEFEHLHQALILCGMRNTNNKLAARAVRGIKDMTDKDIVSKFVKSYCSDDPQSVTSKLELRIAFKQFTDALYPQYGGKPNAVCNLLRDMDYDGTHKTRLDKQKNPVAVFRGIYFNKAQFEIDMKPYILGEVNEIPNESLIGFEKIMHEINSTMLLV